ncbi:response regulator [Flavihumibacter petaseus]|uniref:Putative two-component response regulator n=1 Tax=Flavihumibacter petaseus NBRC 106054 TaxID=1220578 RepID=A0A0E9MZ09_9BACT|nr:response regulator transcription factor [Flavihumibacter petaseus]GAO42768.1 putative two-component response regulator [Flavihumibacter petaseus NBRC 106054]
MKILIADDHAVVRKGLKLLILESYPHAQVEEVANTEALLSEVVTKDWQLVICDMNMPGRSGLDALSQIRQIAPQLPVLIMSVYPQEQYAVRVIKAGASGYLGKDSLHEELPAALRQVLKGKKYISAEAAEKLADAVQGKSQQDAPHESLSDREFDVFKGLAAGKSVSEIADQLSLGVTTVSTYRSRILQKLQLTNNAALIKYALEHRLFDQL